MNEHQGTKRNKELYEQQGKRKNDELYEQQAKGKKLNNPMIYSGDTTDLFTLLSHNPSPAIKDLLQKEVIDKYGLGLKKDTEFVVNDETVAQYSNINR